MDIALRKTIIMAITIIVCLFSITLVAMDKISELAQDTPVSTFDVGTLLSKSFTELNNIDKAQRFINFGFLFKIEIEPKKSGLEKMKQYEIKVVAVDNESEKEYGEEFEQEIISNIIGCDGKKCTFLCSGVGIKKDEKGICIQCYDKRKDDITGSCNEKDFRFHPCPYADRQEELNEIKNYMEEYSDSDVSGLSDEELLAMLKSIGLKETSLRHCKDGIVILGLTGDIGLMQINPNAHKDGNWFILEENIRKARDILVGNLKFFNGYKEQKRLAFAYYNCGNTVKKAIPEYESIHGSGSAKNMEWKDFEDILAKYCRQGDTSSTTVDHVNLIVDNYMQKFINNPGCYDFVCV
ncbi:MAG: hypothetical protein JW716_00500 [Candidatus Aenigmarchaeota archaeon]|nr:hypothetical protein [Candidatus Aenigmarchaeota archaeon]